MQKGNSFLQNRVVKDRFAKREDASAVAARKRRQAKTAKMASGDQLFRAVLDPFWNDHLSPGERPSCAADAVDKLRRASSRRRGSNSASSWSIDEEHNAHGYSLVGQAVVDNNKAAVEFLVDAKASLKHPDGNGGLFSVVAVAWNRAAGARTDREID